MSTWGLSWRCQWAVVVEMLPVVVVVVVVMANGRREGIGGGQDSTGRRSGRAWTGTGTVTGPRETDVLRGGALSVLARLCACALAAHIRIDGRG
ncbi:hypothetical protein DFH27DRAFT_572816 [Peziza echinospora]|nr:hypothetical protein DFH27DRAFT_572816 [Peziza echinospora]